MTEPGAASSGTTDWRLEGLPPDLAAPPVGGAWQRRLWLLPACGFALLIAALATIMAISLRGSEADAWVARTLVARGASGALLGVVEDAEGSARSYLLNRDPAVLGRYDAARAALPAAEARLRALTTTTTTPAQTALLTSLAPLIAQRMGVLAVTIAIAGNGDPKALADRLRERDGTEMMRHIRADLAAFDQAEADLLDERETAARNARMQLLLGSSGALTLALLLGGFTALLSKRQAGALRQANARLAGTVSDRTGALRDSEQRMRLAVEAVGLGLWEMDLHTQHRVLRLDARGAALGGGQLPPDVWLDLDGPELAGWRTLIHPDDMPAHAATRRALIDGTGDMLTYEYRVRRPDGSWVWISTFSTIAERDPRSGLPLRVLTAGQDVTRRKETELELRHAQRLEAIGQLTGGVAHDFNNLLGAILGHTEFLLDRLPERTEERELATEILECALNGAALTQRLLGFARRLPLQPAVINLNEYLPVHVSLLQRTLGEIVTVEVALGPDLWRTLADPSQIVDVLLNLAINARDAMPHGGRLAIRTANAVLDAAYCGHHREATPGEYVLLSVSDTGTGMPPEVLARAMEPFFTTKPPGKGSGLGLSMIYGFARQSGGYLGIDSEPGEGTTVRLYLPRTEAEKALEAAPKFRIKPLPRGDETILVVDDNDSMRATAARNLAALGYRVRLAVDGPAALAVLRAEDPVGLLFTDLVMPNGLSGYQLAEAAQALQPGLPVLFTTGFSAEDDADSSVLDPDALRKPYRRRELAERVRAALDSHAVPGSRGNPGRSGAAQGQRAMPGVRTADASALAFP